MNNTELKNKISRKDTGLEQKKPIKIVQFGSGNFLRAFTDYVIEKMNQNSDFKAGIVNVKVTPSKGSFHQFEDQDNLYTVFVRGVKKGQTIDEKEIISSIQKSINPYEDYQAYKDLAKEEDLQFVFSNTTESGITFDESENEITTVAHHNFPAKLTVLLYERFKHFKGATDKGLTIIPCELIENNAQTLKEYILDYAALWQLETEFANWINENNSFHNTLVDRIVPGYPKDDADFYKNQLDYEDDLMVVAEAFLLWVIEGDKKLLEKIPFDKSNEPVLIVDDLQPYRTSKVRILNGAHTAMVPFSLLYGKETVKDAIDDTFSGEFINKVVFDEIIPVLSLPEDELKLYAEDVFDRFRNPFLKHFLSSIALNSISKFKVRVLPSFLEYVEKFGKLPQNLTFAFAALIRFYQGEFNGQELPVNDDQTIVNEFAAIWKSNDYDKIAEQVLQNVSYWEQDLTQVPDLKEQIAKALVLIDEFGIENAYKKYTI